jgi:hypothetical protein
MKRRIIPGGILALSLAVALMAATASTASANGFYTTWSCPLAPSALTTFDQVPRECITGAELDSGPSFDFGYHLVGTSTSQGFALFGTRGPFNPSIGVSGEYAQTNNCPPTLSAGDFPQIDGCLITVTFTPTPTGEPYGRRPGTLTIGDGVPLALTGGGDPRDSVPPDLKLSGPKRQDPQNDAYTDGDGANANLKVSCGDKWCSARATGRLTNVKKDKLSPDPPPWVSASGTLEIEPGETVEIGPELTRESQRREVSKALAEGKNVKAKVTVRARDAAGNVATAKRTITLVK